MVWGNQPETSKPQAHATSALLNNGLPIQADGMSALLSIGVSPAPLFHTFFTYFWAYALN
jgi:hypothetical protein